MILHRFLLLSILLMLGGCSFNQLTVRASMPMIEGGIQALYKEPDLELARAAFPPNIELLEGMLINDPANEKLHTYAAQAYYGYAFGFIEDSDKTRASNFYYRGFRHGLLALNEYGLGPDTFSAELKNVADEIKQLNNNAVATMFWTASCLAKWIDMNRDNPQSIAELPKAVMLMERVLELDENYFLAGPHVFFGVYYGSRSPMLGGDFKKSEHHFDMARKFNNNRLLIIDVLQAQYLERQQFDQATFHQLLQHVLMADDNLYPEQALANAIAKNKAQLFMQKEQQWF